MFLNRYLTTIAMAALFAGASIAIPSKPGLITYDNDGNPIEVRLIGDENSHIYISSDGYPLLRDAADVFHYAVKDANGEIIASMAKALNPSERDAATVAMLKSIDRESIMDIMTKAREERRANIRRTAAPRRISDESYLNSFPTKGSPKCLAILVEFQDVKFTVENPAGVFYDMLNKEGFDMADATGSVADYFKASSNGQFTPQFDVYGPVTLPQNMSYYGENYGDSDLRPYEMVPQACGLLDDKIDFTQYDTDGDGVIDNVYLFYAGYGEADGGPAASVWPHSWNLHDDLGFDYYFDGKLLNHYATSNELAGGFGTKLAGIGVFCHEFGHVMGLPDLYSTVYSSVFTPGNWSVMDHGSYNNDCRTPPTHTAYERYCFNWIDPEELTNPKNVTMYPMSQIGNYEDAYIIRTENPGEYYVLENRQQRGWDEFIPSHGMLVWHIEFVPDIWNLNIVNVGKQYIDIVEADNDPNSYTIEGDPFPGSANVTEFTDYTTPSMRSSLGNPLHAPITEIKEINGVISFMFKGGEDIFDPVVAHPAANIEAGAFDATWGKVSKSSGYLLSVYQKDRQGAKKYLNGYMRREVGDVDSFRVEGLEPLNDYYYVVQATNGRFYSSDSNEVHVATTEPTLDYLTPVALEATDVKAYGFTANWEEMELADSYTVSLYAVQLGEPYTFTTGFDDNLVPDNWKMTSCSFDSRTAYCITPPSLKMTVDGASLTTATYRDGIRSLDFWMRSNIDSDINQLLIEGYVKNEWVAISSVTEISTEWKEISIDDMPLGCTALRLTYTRNDSGNIFIDDLTVGYGGEYELLPISGKTDLAATAPSSYIFTDLQPETEYSYSVTAHNSRHSSHPSAMISVKTKSLAGMPEVGTGNATDAEYFNLQGLKVSRPAKGEIYLMRKDGKVRKVLYGL